ncbi:MAG TPA: hypothetical protein VFA12_07710 [Stellaceae bacterium]|nr:hypothetical protein [Stellaceae bacterium]
MSELEEALARLEQAVARLEAAAVELPEPTAAAEIDREAEEERRRLTAAIVAHVDAALARIGQVLGEA